MKLASLSSPERTTKRVAVLMTPTEKVSYDDRASSMGLSLGHFFSEAGAAYASFSTSEQSEQVAL